MWICLLLPLGLKAESFGAGTQAAPWLKLPNAARAAAMGEAAVAVPGDVNSISVNPAGLSEMQGSQASVLHHAYVQDSSIEHIAFGMKAGAAGGAALGVDYLNFGAVDRYELDSSGNLQAKGSFNPSSMAVNLGYGRALGSFAAGLNLKMVSQSLDGSSSSSAFGADLGASWRQGKEGVSAGLCLQNLGSPLDGAGLPMNFKLGAAYGLAMREGADHLLLAADANLPSADSAASSFGVGGEYAGASLWALRAGYKVAGNGGAGGLSAGAGLSYSIASLDYAFLSQGALGSSNQLSLTLKF
jgi:hypothetical protein